MKLFYYWQTFVRARFKGVCLLTKTVFQLSWKKSLRCAIFWLVVWTTFLERHLKKFWKFWISEFPPTFHGKVRFFLKKSENNIFTKKIFFFFDEVLKGYQEVPQVKNFFFPPTHWLGMYEEADPCQFGLKKILHLGHLLIPLEDLIEEKKIFSKNVDFWFF